VSNREPPSGEALATALGAQKWRVLAALLEADRLDADPILRDDESLDSEAYVSLVYELHHVHLPKLAAAGFVRFDRQVDEVTHGPLFEAIRPHLDGVEERR